MNFLEARHLVSSFQGGEPLPFLFACSGTAEPFDLYLRAAAAKRGRTAEVNLLPFNTLAQALHRDADPMVTEVFLLAPWDFVASPTGSNHPGASSRPATQRARGTTRHP